MTKPRSTFPLTSRRRWWPMVSPVTVLSFMSRTLAPKSRGELCSSLNTWALFSFTPLFGSRMNTFTLALAEPWCKLWRSTWFNSISSSVSLKLYLSTSSWMPRCPHSTFSRTLLTTGFCQVSIYRCSSTVLKCTRLSLVITSTMCWTTQPPLSEFWLGFGFSLKSLTSSPTSFWLNYGWTTLSGMSFLTAMVSTGFPAPTTSLNRWRGSRTLSL